MLEKFGLTCAIQPIGGWRYPQHMPDGSITRIPIKGCAGSDSALVEQVKVFRIGAGIDLGDVERDCAEYIKEASPINNRYPNRKNGVKPVRVVFRPYIERIKDWLMAVGRTQPRLLIEDEADARSAICLKCSQNVPWRVGCVPCVENIVHRGQHVRQRASYKHDKSLGACRAHDFLISTAVWIDRDDLPPINESAPSECWLRS